MESFYWQVTTDLSSKLKEGFELLRQAGGKFSDKGRIAHELIKAGIPKTTAYRRIDALKNSGFLMEQDGQWTLRIPEQKGPNNETATISI